MKPIISALLAAGCIISSACTKELGYTGFVSPDSPTDCQITLSTDKAVYSPGEAVKFTASQALSGAYYIRYCHLGNVIQEMPVTSGSWTWTAPSSDYKGYMAELCHKSPEGETVLATIAVDVSSTWDRFPRYGFLSKFDAMDAEASHHVISELNRLHINGVQFQDWHYKHHWPLGGTRENPLENYLDIASRNTSLTTLKNYISSIHSFGMKAIFYNLCFGALNDAATDGVSEQWYLFKDRKHTDKDYHGLSAPFKSSIYLVNPANEEWQSYIGQRNDDVYAVLDFDGYQIDQLGDRGTLYDYNGQKVSLPECYASFINSMKARHPEKDLIMNAVSNFGDKEIAGTGNVAFCYNEMWGSEDQFTDLMDAVENNYSYSGNTLRTVFAAYMNYDKANNPGTFNTPGILLTDAVMFAMGGSHLEMGEHMLGKEYFPNNNLGMMPELKESLIRYYDFMTAYQNLLRDGGEFNSVNAASTDGKMQIKPWAPQEGNVISLCKKVGKHQIVHLLNFSQANSTSWRDIDGTMPEPALIDSPSVTIAADGEVQRIWMASPDIDSGAYKILPFTSEGNSVTVTLPSLKYWDMIVIEY